jgi:hypothetical protein
MADKKLTFTQCKVDNGIISELSSPKPFVASLNPEGYEVTSTIDYSQEQTQGQPDQEVKFRGVRPEIFTLKPFVLDATGAVPDSKITDLRDSIAALDLVALKFVGKEHETPIVKISWGTFLHYARVNSMKVEYTLFKSDGTPLRAKITVTFSEYKTQAEIQKEAAKSSPDLTHLVQVKAGDTLPLLCHRIYKDSAYFLAVAGINRLTNFRRLTPGTFLEFPPLAG